MDRFRQFAENYRLIHDTNLKNTGYTSSYFAERKIKEIVKHTKCATAKKLKILDLGCGDGLGVFYFRKYFPRAFIIGLDICEKSIKIALKRSIHNTEFRIYDGKKIPFNKGTFDIILLAGLLHHLADRKHRLNILKECYRVLKTESNLFIFEHNPYNPITCRIVHRCIFDKDVSMINFLEVKKMLKEVGFEARFRFIIFLPGFLKAIECLENLVWWIPLGGQYYSIARKSTG
ncbi:MAG: hypothetical protein B6D56_06960 [Candidatus Omnitrophica bacterium 4484_70.1]|nr:MAG: hypothetical protein B6D56_06960 [Candidatus Omnitrophica bacterium 4484_70.1]